MPEVENAAPSSSALLLSNGDLYKLLILRRPLVTRHEP